MMEVILLIERLKDMINKKKGIVQPKPEDSDIPMPDMRVMNIMMYI